MAEIEYWAKSVPQVCELLETRTSGLTTAEAKRRLLRDGPNILDPHLGDSPWRLLARQFLNPIMLILIGATIISILVGDVTDGLIILAIVIPSGILGFWREHRAGRAMADLLRRINMSARVLRDGVEVSIPIEEIVQGDIVLIRIGDVVSAELRLIDTSMLEMDESALTGEPYPQEKQTDEVARTATTAERKNIAFAGTHAVSGTGAGIVVATGERTQIGALNAELEKQDVQTSFEQGSTNFGLMLLRAMTVLLFGVFIVNIVLHRPVIDSLLFSLALAVGLTPQMLPVIVSISLSVGAKRMANEKVLVKRLDAIEDFGAMTILCTDKTGTITRGVVDLDCAIDLKGEPSSNVLRLAAINAGLQKGFPNPLDEAVLRKSGELEPVKVLDEVTYDFARRRLSLLVDDEGPLLITKGALQSMLEVCAFARVGSEVFPLAQILPSINEQFARLSAQGFRVLGVATRRIIGKIDVEILDETEMIFEGLLGFHDPAKVGAKEAIAKLAQLGIGLCLVTGDNPLVAKAICGEVGIDAGNIISGNELTSMSQEDFARSVLTCRVFAEVDPMQKESIIQELRRTGHTVGVLGDGINDSAALKAADVGISVDSAVDVAKAAAAIVLLEKNLQVICDGVQLGRTTFANTMKYVRVTISANFGNMLSMAIASLFLPFLPLLPAQILLLNFLSDFPALMISTDSVDAEECAKPRSWDISAIRSFMIVFGITSSLFDLLTFATLQLAVHADAAVFRSGWFVESIFTELVAMLVLRTSRPFWRSRPSGPLLVTSAVVAVVTSTLPLATFGRFLKFEPFSLSVLAVLAGLTALYILANEIVKTRKWDQKLNVYFTAQGHSTEKVSN